MHAPETFTHGLAPDGPPDRRRANACACGSTSKTYAAGGANPSVLSVSITESGASANFTVPSSIAGGLVNLRLANNGKAPHSAQLIRFDAPHTAQQVLAILGGNSNKTPSWIHGKGGLGRTAPGHSASAFVNLPAGRYLVADVGPSNGPPPFSELSVTAGQTGRLPATPTTVTAANPSKDHYKWQIAGKLTAGLQSITFASKGKTTQHLIEVARLIGNPANAKIIQALKKHGPPPPFLDRSSFSGTAILDSGKSQVTPLSLSKPGTYVLLCRLTDRDGGKAHFEEGLLTRVTVK